ncbi:MAG TPA: anthranilate synthase component I family protein, partial [Caulobacteraceae bacterium]
RDPDWPDLILARYDRLLAFDHAERRVLAVGRGADAKAAALAADEAATWLAASPGGADPGALSLGLEPEAPPEAYETQVAAVVGRIRAGEIFQANIARAWRGRLRPGRIPFEVFERLARDSAAPYAAYWRLPGRALVSNSPERFLALDAGGTVTAEPIKGTRPRDADPAADAALASELADSPKDRAENLMIVDLMRNDLARVCIPGSVRVERLWGLQSFANVHHLVSTVTGRVAPGADAATLLQATFPPGSITGAPKVQAMKVIAALEPPRGPWCGSLFLAGFDGTLEASVLIRTLALVEDGQGWRFRTCAGAGVVADSDPEAERLETDAKLSALRRALTGR